MEDELVHGSPQGERAGRLQSSAKTLGVISALIVAMTSAAGCAANQEHRVSVARSAFSARDSVASSTAKLPEGCAGSNTVDVLSHSIELSLSLAPASLSGRGELDLRTRRTTGTITLDAKGLRISEVTLAGRPLSFHQVEDRLCADLSGPVPAGTRLSVKLVWVGSTRAQVPRFLPDQVWAGYRAAAWMPTVQDPAQRARLSLRITTSAGLEVAASGRKTGSFPVEGGLVVHSFVLDRPTPPFLYAFAAGRFDAAERSVDDIKLRALGPAGSDLQGALAITAPMYRLLTSRLGARLPSGEYLQVFVNDDDAAQEAAGLSLLTAHALDDLKNDPTDDWIFSHELSHQWFAWLVPCVDFSDFWLNEGFATFLTAVVKEQRWGHPAYEREVKLWKTRSSQVHRDGRDAPLSLAGPTATLPVAPPGESELPPRGVTYSRGALVLDKLRRELGEAVFWKGIQRYVRDRADKGARSEDLRLALEAASGRDLRAFFARWVFSSAPDL